MSAAGGDDRPKTTALAKKDSKLEPVDENFASDLGNFVAQELGVDMQGTMTRCVFCKSSFQDARPTTAGKCEIKVLQCLHSACGWCLEEFLLDRREVMCPICDASTGEQNYNKYLCNFPVHQGLDFRAIGEEKNVACDECVDGCSAVLYCQQCIRSLCSECSEHHKRSKSFNMHHLVTLREQQEHSLHRAAFCPMHVDQMVEFFCEDCNIMCCRECILTEHENHCYKLPVGGLVEKQRQVVKDQIQQLRHLAKLLQERHQELAQMIKDFDREFDTAKKNIENLEMQVTSAIQQRRETMMIEIESFSAAHRAAFEKKRASLTSMMVSMWRAIDFVEKVLARGTNIEVLFLKSYISAQYLLGDEALNMGGKEPLTPSVQIQWHGNITEVLEAVRSMADATCSSNCPTGKSPNVQSAEPQGSAGDLKTSANSVGTIGDARSNNQPSSRERRPSNHSSKTGVQLLLESHQQAARAIASPTDSPILPFRSPPVLAPTKRASPADPKAGTPKCAVTASLASSPSFAGPLQLESMQQMSSALSDMSSVDQLPSWATVPSGQMSRNTDHMRQTSEIVQVGSRSCMQRPENPVQSMVGKLGGPARLPMAYGGATRPQNENPTPPRVPMLLANSSGVHVRTIEQLKECGIGTVRNRIGCEGVSPGCFRSPCGLSVDDTRIYVADTLNNRIQAFDVVTHALLGSICINKPGPGAEGRELQDPSGMCVIEDGHIAVVEYGLDRVTTIRLMRDSLEVVNTRTIIDQQLYGPFGVNAGFGRIVLADSCNHRVLVFELGSGTTLFEFGSEGSGEGQFMYPECVTLLSNGDMAISDKDNNRIQMFTEHGKFLSFVPGNWCMNDKGPREEPVPPGLLHGPMGVCSDRQDRLYICDCAADRVQIFTRTGQWLWSSDWNSVTGGPVMTSPTGIAIDSAGTVYVSSDHCVHIFGL